MGDKFRFLYRDIFTGRLGRLSYLLRVVIFSFLLGLAEIFIQNIWVFAVVGVCIFYWGCSFTAKRLHDIGLSGWYQAPAYLLIILLFLLPDYVAIPSLEYIGFIAYVLFNDLLFVFPGLPKDNRFGVAPYLL